MLVLFLAGVVSGLSGFAFSAVAACVLWLLPPLQAVPLIMLLSACGQLLTAGRLRKEMVLRSTAEREGALAYSPAVSPARHSASGSSKRCRAAHLPAGWVCS